MVPARVDSIDTRARRGLGCALVVLGLLLAVPTQAKDCLTDRIDERVRISYVHDGDTLTLQDGRHLRLIGINSPELGRDDTPNEPGALAARDSLRRLVFFNRNQLGLRFDRERRDRHGRLLAHAFLDDGRNLTAVLLEQGQGFALTVPPNTWQAECYHGIADSARGEHTGLWALPAYAPKPATGLPLSTEGFQYIRGRVSHVSEGQYNRWINLVGNVALKIAKDDLDYFKDFPWDRLAGREIEASGWMYQRRGQLRMPVHHPLMLDIVTPPQTAPETR